jgi:GNAT superfamily N-acetyltransferase
VESDKEWIYAFISEHWGSKEVVVHNTVFIPGKLNGFIAEENECNVGLVTYQIKDSSCEIVTLNSIIENKGIGRKLVKLVEEEAIKHKCGSVWLITTNDNLKAVKFYQKIGYRLVKVYPDAVDNSRMIKPEIPLIAENGIPIRDELKFEKKLMTPG